MSGGRHTHRSRNGRGVQTGYGSLLTLFAELMALPRQEAAPVTDHSGRPLRSNYYQPTPTDADRFHTDELRASDAERHAVVNALSRHLADGRLEASEFEARVDQALISQTRSELTSLLADLPSVPVKTSTPQRHCPGVGALIAVLLIGLVVVAVMATVFALL